MAKRTTKVKSQARKKASSNASKSASVMIATLKPDPNYIKRLGGATGSQAKA